MFVDTWICGFQIICNITEVNKYFVGILNLCIALPMKYTKLNVLGILMTPQLYTETSTYMWSVGLGLVSNAFLNLILQLEFLVLLNGRVDHWWKAVKCQPLNNVHVRALILVFVYRQMFPETKVLPQVLQGGEQRFPEQFTTMDKRSHRH